jgi:hypothetical protein
MKTKKKWKFVGGLKRGDFVRKVEKIPWIDAFESDSHSFLFGFSLLAQTLLSIQMVFSISFPCLLAFYAFPFTLPSLI